MTNHEAFSERWFAEPELREDLRATEAELLDAYARWTISGKQRRQIERWLLASITQQRKLAFAEALVS